jgi:hypothetical protein
LTDAAQVILVDLLTELERPDLQWVNAICAAVFGIAALADGRLTFKVLVIAVVAVVVFFVVSSRIHWTSHYGIYLKYVAAAEVAAFAAYLTFTGYGGHHTDTSNLLAPKKQQDYKAGSTELAVGFVLGIYMFHLVQGLALQIPYVDSIADGSGFDVVVGTLMVLLGCWMIVENKGAGRVFGFLAPLFGSSLVIAVIGYAVKLTCSLPVVAKHLHIEVPSSCAAKTPVISFWLMIVSPMANKEVGLFHCLGKEFSMGKTTFQVDRILGMLFMFLLWFICAKMQLKRDGAIRSVGNGNLKERMLVPAQNTEVPAQRHSV